MTTRGSLIVLSGMSAAGKTTLLREQVKKRVPRALYLAQPTKEWKEDVRVQRLIYGQPVPGFTERDEIEFSIGTRLRQQEGEIVPALLAGRDVILHRYIESMMAYYYAAGTVPMEYVECKIKGIRTPDIVFFFDIEPQECIKRVTRRDKPYPPHLTDLAFVTAMREFFLSCHTRTLFVRIDANRWNSSYELLQRTREAAKETPGIRGVLSGASLACFVG